MIVGLATLEVSALPNAFVSIPALFRAFASADCTDLTLSGAFLAFAQVDHESTTDGDTRVPRARWPIIDYPTLFTAPCRADLSWCQGSLLETQGNWAQHAQHIFEVCSRATMPKKSVFSGACGWL